MQKILSFNIKKPHIYFDNKFSIGSIELVESFINIGTTLDSKICFNGYIVKITNKASKFLVSLHRLVQILII